MKKTLCILVMILLLAAGLPGVSEGPEAAPVSEAGGVEIELAEDGLPEDGLPEGSLPDDSLPEDILLPDDVLPGDILPDGGLIDLDLSGDGLEAGALMDDPSGDGAASGSDILLEPQEEACFIESSRDSDALFAGYANGILHGGPRANTTAYAREGLNEQERIIYDALKPLIAEVAEGRRAATEFEIPVGTLLGLTRTTGRALTGAALSNPMTEDEKARVTAAWRALYTYALETVADALWFDCTFELYWLDRYDAPIRAVRPALKSRYSAELGDWELYVADGACVAFRFPVLARYQGDAYVLDPARIDQAKQARANAQAIVDQYAGCSDYARLGGYVMEICKRVRYDGEAATLAWQDANPQVQDPWKLIWVFDGDSDTNAVCEGYAQAFQYLCELTGFDGDIRCRLVTGYARGTEHSWNLVRMDDGRNYLVDVTWMDGDWDDLGDDLAQWISGNWGRLFLCGGSGSVADGYEIVNRDGAGEGLRRYRGDTLAVYPEAALALAPQRYTPTGFQMLPDGLRYFDADGAFVAGKAVLDGYGYRFDADGRLEGTLSGWHDVDGASAFFEADGRLHAAHSPVADAAVPPTCTEPGLTEGSRCSACGAVLVPQSPVEKLGHRWGEVRYAWTDDCMAVTARRTCLNDPAHAQAETVQTVAEVAQAPTCTARGVTAYTARFSRKSFATQRKRVRDIPAAGHIPVADPAVAPTAAAEGLTEGSHCAACGKVLVAQRPVPRLVKTLRLRGSAAREADVGEPLRIVATRGPVERCQSDNPAVASVSQRGRITPRAPGVAVIAIRLEDGARLLLRLTVVDPSAPKSVRIAQGSRAALGVGERLALKAALRPVGAKSALQWRSSDPRVASVGQNGVVRALRPGRTVVAVRAANGKQAAIVVTVNQ